MSEPSVRLLSSMASRELLLALQPRCIAATGIALELEFGGGVAVAERVRQGASTDVVVLSSQVIDQLIAEGRLAPPRVDIARSAIGVAVPAGASLPDLRHEDGVRAAVVAARRVGWSTGPSGQYLEQLFQRWGILEQLRPRIVVAPPGVAVGSLVARGECDLGFQQLSELLALDGIQVAGQLPESIQSITVFAGAVGRDCGDAGAARRTLDFLASPETAAIKQQVGMQSA